MAVTFELANEQAQPTLPSKPFYHWTLPDGSNWTAFYRTANGYLLRFPEMADFDIENDGCKVCCRPAPDVSHDSIRHLYHNQVLPLALSKQGKLVFHASAVAIDGEAVAFVGESGRGKSTLAASYARSGCPILTDDGLALQWNNDSFEVLPGHPWIRLWQDSEEALLPSDLQKGPPLDFTDKAHFIAGDSLAFCGKPLPLRRIYFIGNREVETPDIHNIPGKKALIELVKHSFLLDIEERELLESQFQQFSRLIPTVSFYQLEYPRCFGGLPALMRSISRSVGQ